MNYAFENKTEYLFHMQKEKISFAKYELTSQLHSVQKRSVSLAHDLIIYICFIVVPIILSTLSLILALFGNLALRILFVPLLFIGIFSMLILTPFGTYKLCMGGLMWLFSKYGGTLTLFGNTATVYTYKTEENYCLGKLRRLEDYEKQIADWEEALANGEEIPDYPYLENVCDKMELNTKIKVATINDPIIKRFGTPSLIVAFAALILYTIAIWVIVFRSLYGML